MENLNTLLLNMSAVLSGLLLLIIVILIAKSKPNNQPITCSNLYAYMLRNHHEIGLRYFYDGFVACTHGEKPQKIFHKLSCSEYFFNQGYEYAKTLPAIHTIEDFKEDFWRIQLNYLHSKQKPE